MSVLRAPGRRATAIVSVVALGAALVVAAAGPASAQDAPAAPVAGATAPGVAAAGTAGFTGKIADRVRDASGPVSVFIQLSDTPAVDVFNAERGRGRTPAVAAAAAQDATDAVEQTATGVVSDLRAAGGAPEEIFRTSNAVSGLAVTADADRVRELAASADVVAVYPLTPRTLSNANAAVLTNSLKTWQDTGLLGDDVRVGIIDTGIDYTHADFGGPGTVEAFDAIDETTVAGSGFPTAKVVGGTDFVGNGYDAGAEAGSPALVPQPDPNPIDCNDHGSHVAGTAGGLGVNADGSTYTGDYRSLDEDALQNMKIGPGTAPRALLYALKVFGCEGSTNVTTAALDWALDPDGDKNFSDHLDVVNLSLGSDFGASDDPENLFVQKLSDNGVLSVFSQGNAGDLYDAGGTPGNSPSALTVASSKDAYVLRDGAEVTAPAGLAGVKPGQYSQAYVFRTSGDLAPTAVTNLTDAANLDGCAPFSDADAARVKGKIAWLEWDDNDATRKCGSAGRTNNATAAGAVGAVFTSGLEQFAAGLTGNATIPVFQITSSDTAALRPAMEAGTLQLGMRDALRNSAKSYFPAISDTLSSFSSRGGRGPAVKPDVTAPGDTIASALSGSGDDVLVISGTSMASPHTAGIATLVRQKHPEWSVEEVKAAVMNTALTDVSATDGGAGPFYGPGRQGAGRIDAAAATGTEVLAMVKDDPGYVSATFGVVEVGAAKVTRTKTVRVENKGTRARTMALSYDPATEQPGVSYAVAAAGGGSAVTLSPKGVAEVTVTMTADPAALRKTLDPTIEAQQAGLARQYVADSSGYLTLTPAATGTQGALRVPVYTAAKPVADITGPSSVTVGAGTRSAPLPLTGRGLDQGTGSEAYVSLVSGLQLTGSSPEQPTCAGDAVDDCTVNTTAKGADLRYVGVGSTVRAAVAAGTPDEGLLGFGFATWGSITNLGSTNIPYVDIDTTGDGTPDFETYLFKPADTDVLLAATVDLARGKQVDLQAVNGLLGDTDSNLFDTSVLVLPVAAAKLGVDLRSASAPITFSAGIQAQFGGDTIEDMTYDVTAPALVVETAGDQSLIARSANGTRLVVDRRAPATTTTQVLLLHHHNAVGDQAQVVPVTAAPQAPGTTCASARYREQVQRALDEAGSPSPTASSLDPDRNGTACDNPGNVRPNDPNQARRSAPTGNLDAVELTGPQNAAVTVRGWALDRDVPTWSAGVHVYVDGRGYSLGRAADSRPDVARAFSSLRPGAAHGFRATLPISASPGNHTVCVYAINYGPYSPNTKLGCRTFAVAAAPQRSPVGTLDPLRFSSDGAPVVRGWATDADDLTQKLRVHVYVDGRGAAALSTGTEDRPDVRAATGAPDAGFRVTLPVQGPGKHTVCAYGINIGATGTNTLLGCRSFG